MAPILLKVQKNKNITLPTWLIRQFQVSTGDFVRLEVTKVGIVLKPVKMVDPSQAYFWTEEWQSGEKEAQEDIQKGRVRKFKRVKDLMKDLKR